MIVAINESTLISKYTNTEYIVYRLFVKAFFVTIGGFMSISIMHF